MGQNDAVARALSLQLSTMLEDNSNSGFLLSQLFAEQAEKLLYEERPVYQAYQAYRSAVKRADRRVIGTAAIQHHRQQLLCLLSDPSAWDLDRATRELNLR